MEASTYLERSAADIFTAFILFSDSKFFIHLDAYNCGSMSKGKEILLYTKIPLFTETLSDGNPFAFQFLI